MVLPQIGDFVADGSRRGNWNVSQPFVPKPPAAGPNASGSNRATILKGAQVKALSYVFQQADLNGDGVVDAHEMRIFLMELGYPHEEEDVAALMKQLDADGNGAIEFREFKKV